MSAFNVSEASAERAVATLERIIDAARNANQAGENAAVCAAAAPSMLDALEVVARPYGMLDMAVSKSAGAMQDEMVSVARLVRLAIASARGAA